MCILPALIWRLTSLTTGGYEIPHLSSNVSQREYGVYTAQWTKAVETIYYGSNSSEQQIRQYNKLVEQTKKNMPLPDGVEHWMRLELQLRGRKPTEWVERAKGMLDDFRLPNYDRIQNKNDRMALFALEKGLLDWSDFSDKIKKHVFVNCRKNSTMTH